MRTASSYLMVILFVLCLAGLKGWYKEIIQQLTDIQTEISTIKKSFTVEATGNQIVTLSAYHPKSKGINSDKTPNRTATMQKPIAGYTLAISDELFKMGWLNKKIYIDGWGVGQATDRMGKNIKGKQIDVCSPSLKYAKEFGIKKDVQVVVLN